MKALPEPEHKEESPIVDWAALAAAERWLDEKALDSELKRLDSAVSRVASLLAITVGVSSVFLVTTFNAVRTSGLASFGSLQGWVVGLFAGGLVLLILAVICGLTALLDRRLQDLPRGDQFYARQEEYADDGHALTKPRIDRTVAYWLRETTFEHKRIVDARFVWLRWGVRCSAFGLMMLAVVFFLVFLSSGKISNVMSTNSNTSGSGNSGGSSGNAKPTVLPQTGLTGRTTSKGDDGRTTIRKSTGNK